MSEYLTRLGNAISLLEVAEDQIVEARTDLQMSDLYAEADELRAIRKNLNKLLTGLRGKRVEYIDSTPL
jgi:hypothetical protein